MSMFEYQLFCTIAEQKNMARASEMLHITPSAATHAVNALERRVGFPLINRSRRGITLTTNGQLLLSMVQTILSDEELLWQEIAKINGLEKGCVRLGVFDSICTNWLPQILKSFNAKYQHVEVQIFQSGYQEIEEMLLDSALDIGFVSLPSSNRFQSITLTHDRLLCIVPQDFQPKHGSYITADDLRSIPIVISQCGHEDSIQEFFEENGLRTSSQHSVRQDSSAISMVESGICCSILAEWVLRNNPGNYKAYPLDCNKYRTIAIATLRGKVILPATQKMIEEIRNLMQERRDILE